MKISKDEWDNYRLRHPDKLEQLAGIKITRRITLTGAMAQLVLLALGGASGCADEPGGSDTSNKDPSKSNNEDSTPDNSKKSEQNDSESTEASSTEDEDDDTKSSDDPSTSSEEDEDEDEDEDKSSTSDENDTSESDTTDTTDEDESSSDTELPSISIDELLSLILSDAQTLVQNPQQDESEYLEKVHELLARLETTLPDLGVTSGYRLRSLASDGPIEIYEIEMAPGAEIPLHDHRDYIGNLLGWEGSATTTNYTRVEGDVESGWFLLQESAKIELTHGQRGYLGRSTHNFHVVQAGKNGAKLVDVFTYYPGQGGSRFAELDPDPIDSAKKIYRARWSNRAPFDPQNPESL